MSPKHVHFNGSVNLADAESVMREIVARVPAGVRRIPDGETGDRGDWIFYQAHQFLRMPWLVPMQPFDPAAGDHVAMPQLRLADGVDPATVDWPARVTPMPTCGPTRPSPSCARKASSPWGSASHGTGPAAGRQGASRRSRKDAATQGGSAPPAALAGCAPARAAYSDRAGRTCVPTGRAKNASVHVAHPALGVPGALVGHVRPVAVHHRPGPPARQPTSRIRSPSEPPLDSQSLAKVCRNIWG